jgi:hypothetical protein
MLPQIYIFLVIATGASIGAISGLTKSPVGTTVLELIAFFVVGVSGVYLASEGKVWRRRKVLLRSLGSVGLGFLGAFWIGLLASQFYRNANVTVHPSIAGLAKNAANIRQDEIIAQIKRIELEAHLIAMGVSSADRRAFVNLVAGKSGVANAGVCRRAMPENLNAATAFWNNTKSLSQALGQCGSLDTTARAAAAEAFKVSSSAYATLAPLSKQDNNWLNGDLSNFDAVLLYFLQEESLRAPPASCGVTDDVAKALEGILLNCEAATLLDSALAFSRAAASEFHNRWETNLAGSVEQRDEETEALGVMERATR